MADPKKKEPLEDIEAAIEEIMADQGKSDLPEDEDVAPEADPLEEVDEVEALRIERDQLKDKFMRALADAENARKRSDRDRREAENYGGSKLARDMLPVYDNMKRAMEAIDDDLREKASGLTEGLELTMRELLNIFSKHGIRILAPEVGDKFDPIEHEAMFEAPVPGTNKGEIIQVMAEGFMLHDRLLRAAQVGVSSNPG
ncbi:molecular chaperone GrpE [Maritimibacter alkaliphilus HTCC2654]|uniref:Protein GrpE n=1 Tax=Maritimibacter alkaliphilus HTCC2654 TaxID=314271 RepID=A3VD73_9RHOB|nr:nucleotide exchange factor GrpE [Maritimibacter alkaliphilus]EAQ14104.1 putative chaperone protein GrpE (heat shock protein) [Maritimibacter alkaliphilus HTCC2654]TYP84296.1 molecular chaperone GrpE [Maritimibacter alkaliphilus HTCC2654]